METRGFLGWPDEARRLVENAAEAHGGFELYSRLRSVALVVEHLGGLLPVTKGLGRTYPQPKRATVFPHEHRVVLDAYPSEGKTAVFVNGVVRVEHSDVVSDKHRQRFRGLRKLRYWDFLDALYFFGYALGTYLQLPFVLRDTSFVALRRIGSLRGVTVDFPSSFHTHSQRQSFYFDESGLLRRHQYVAEIIGAWAHGAHFSSDYTKVSGFSVATQRRVFAAPFQLLTPIPVLQAQLQVLSVDHASRVKSER